MRFERLDLICYGCFQGKQLSFPSGKADLHIIYGTNEAGKSTALNAIEDLLFGIPKHTSYNFLFDNKDLRIGAVLHNIRDTRRLSFRRKKGMKDTILDEHDTPLSGSILDDFLHGLDRSFFERMFSLGHERLRQGGKAILEEKDDIGQTLFSASAGLLGLGDVLKKFEADADQIWGIRKSGQRLYSQAQDSYDDAERRKREATVLTRNWKEVRGRLDKISEDHEAKNLEYAEKTALQEKLQRIRRVLPSLGQIRRVEGDLATLGTAPRFSIHAATVLDEAEAALSRVDASLKTLSEQIAEIQKELKRIIPNTALLEREAKIKKLENDRAIVEKHETDIPNRQTEIDVLEKRRHDLAGELGWNPQKFTKENFFPQTLVLRIESHMGKKNTLETRLESASEALREAEGRHHALREAMMSLGEIQDVQALDTALRHARTRGDLRADFKRVHEEITGLNRTIEGSLERLRPWEGTVEQLKSLPVSEAETVAPFHEEISDLTANQQEVSRDKETVQDQLHECKLEKEQLLRDKQAVAREQLEEARQIRDSGWDIIRRKYIDREGVPEEEVKSFFRDMEISEAFEKSVEDADSLADNRFVHAEETAQLAEISRTFEKLEYRLETLLRKEQELQGQERKLLKRWRALWDDCGFVPLGPADMLGWIERRRALLNDYDRKLACVDQEESLKAEREEERNLLISALEEAGQETASLTNQSLQLLLEHVETLKSDIDKKKTREEEFRKQMAAAQEQWDQAKKKFTIVEKDNLDWEANWHEALKTAGFFSDSSMQDVEFYLSAIKEIKEKGEEISRIRTTRIETMKGDIQRFHENVGKLVEDLNIDHSKKEEKESVDYLIDRLNEERAIKSKNEILTGQLETLTKREAEHKELRGDALARLQPLLETGVTKELSVLRGMISDSSQLISLEQKKEERLTSLMQQGDGKTREELEKECEGQDPDQVEAQLGLLKNELSDITEALQQLAGQKTQARVEMETISGRADAAAAEADRQLALADMGDAANRYVRLRTAALLLRWGMEKFRKEKQGPLLKRAAEIFKVLTLNNFLKLTVELDDNDALFLAGIRSNETRVGVEDMSDGTVDQLYLALRLAAIEEYVQKSNPLPFVADDLFINYDDSRAAAGFKCLADLAQKTQVLFFTHHEHLIKVATQSLSSEQFLVHNLA